MGDDSSGRDSGPTGTRRLKGGKPSICDRDNDAAIAAVFQTSRCDISRLVAVTRAWQIMVGRMDDDM
jgi:hypothetical protein